MRHLRDARIIIGTVCNIWTCYRESFKVFECVAAIIIILIIIITSVAERRSSIGVHAAARARPEIRHEKNFQNASPA